MKTSAGGTSRRSPRQNLCSSTPQVRRRLAAGGSKIRTLGPSLTRGHVKAGGHYIFSAELWVAAEPKAHKLIRSIASKENITIFDVADALAGAGIDVNDNP